MANAPDNTAHIRNSLFLRNTARHPGCDEGGELIEGGYGGGIWRMTDGDTHIENTTISGNVANTGGGGLFHDADGKLKLSNVTIWRNKAPIGGRRRRRVRFVPEVPRSRT